MSRLVAGLVAVVIVLGYPGAAQATAYDYRVGHPARPDQVRCTGGYAVAGPSGVFVTTAGHCAVNANGVGRVGVRVWGTDEMFGTIIRNDRVGDFYSTNSFDGALIRLDPDDTAYQIVTDPITQRTPGSGRVRGYYANSALTNGLLIGKMGTTTGWTEGQITQWRRVTYSNGWSDYLLCSTVRAAGGDSGGPVWRNDRNGVMAIGIVIAVTSTGEMCFNPIQNVLNRFGATLPTFSSSYEQSGSAIVVTKSVGKPAPVDPNPVNATLLN